MKIAHASAAAKGWCFGHWNSSLEVAVGYANEGIDDPHVHTRLAEVYLVARGTSVMRVEQETVELSSGDVIVIEPGEAHTFLSSSPDYFHFVVHTPGPTSDEARAERLAVSRSRLGL